MASGSGGDVCRGVKPDPALFGSLLVAALWLVIACPAVAWWRGSAEWGMLWSAGAAAGLAFWAMRD